MARRGPQDMGKTLRRLMSYMGKHKTMLFFVAVLVIISTGAKIFGTYMLRPIINNYIVPGDAQGLLQAIVLLGGVYLVGAMATLGYTQVMVVVAQRIISEIRMDLFEKTQKLPLRFFDTHTHGELMSHFTNDIDTVNEAFNNSFTAIIQSFIMIVGTMAMIIYMNWKLSLIVIATYILMVMFIKWAGRQSKKFFSIQQRNYARMNGYLQEMMAGQRVVKVFNYEESAKKEFNTRVEDLRQASTNAITMSGMMVPFVVNMSYINYALVACIGGISTINGYMDIGSLSSYLVYVRETALPINIFSQQSNFIINALAGAERIFDMMDVTPEVDRGTVTLAHAREENGKLIEVSEPTETLVWRHPRKDGTVELVPLVGEVEFHDVHFSYDRGYPILKGISLSAAPNEKIAFVGSTGAGKTTVTNLINRFYELDSGSITYDGIDIRLIDKDDLRRSMTVVLQDTHLFTGTIADNIRYGKLDATMDEVVEAAKLANAHSFIRRLPKGYDTMLSGDGGNLSQGQRQLLSIARAAIARNPVLILDEATSSIDTRTEKLIEKGLDRLMQGKTVFVIAHRLSTVRNSDAIMVMEQGEIIERGSHDKLLEEHGRYYQLYTGQFELE